MSDEPIRSSFRDPSGLVFTREGRVLRQVNQRYREHYDLLMQSGLYEALLGNGQLIAHEETTEPGLSSDAYKVLQPRRVPLVSYPYEWSFGQLKDAALTTLGIARLALGHGMTLKDATAYNIQFVDGHPVLIDTLSFECYEEGKPWRLSQP